MKTFDEFLDDADDEFDTSPDMRESIGDAIIDRLDCDGVAKLLMKLNRDESSGVHAFHDFPELESAFDIIDVHLRDRAEELQVKWDAGAGDRRESQLGDEKYDRMREDEAA